VVSGVIQARETPYTQSSAILWQIRETSPVKIVELDAIPLKEWYEIVALGIRRPDPDRIHVTELCEPPRILYLRWKHWDELVACPIRAWAMLLGTAWHKFFLPQVGRLHPDWLIEPDLSAKVGDAAVVGTPDIVDLDGKRVIDVKLTNLAKGYSKGDPTHKLQTYIYSWLIKETYGVQIERCELWYFYKDHVLSRAMRERRYQLSPAEVFKYSPLDEEEVYSLIEDKVRTFRDSVRTGQVPRVCTPEERWSKADEYKVMKKGARRATKVYKDPEEAKVHASRREDLRVKAVPGDSLVRCRDWCDVAPFCDFAAEHKVSGYQPYWLMELPQGEGEDDWPEALRWD